MRHKKTVKRNTSLKPPSLSQAASSQWNGSVYTVHCTIAAIMFLSGF